MSGAQRPDGPSPVGAFAFPQESYHADNLPTMTGAERLELQTVAEILRRVENKVDSQGLRIHNIEIALAHQEGGDIADARNAERRTSESRWRKGVAVSIALAIFGTLCSVALGLANLALNSTT